MTVQPATLVLDSEGLSAWLAQDRAVLALLAQAVAFGADVVVPANVIIEVSHAKVDVARLNWTLSRVKVEPVTAESAKAAARLLRSVGLHGHKYAIDATVAEAARRQTPPVVVVTSDVDDMHKLCPDSVRLVAL